MTEFTRERELSMIKTHDQWPGECLCVKKRPGPGETGGAMGYAAFGVMTTSALPLVVYLRPNFARTRTYDSAEAMMADGWKVD